jgi:IS30 family transposase
MPCLLNTSCPSAKLVSPRCGAKRYGSYDSRGRLAGKGMLTERPAIVDGRRQLRHWEGDTVMGAGQAARCVLTFVERKRGYLHLGQLARRTPGAVTRRATRLIRR